MSSEKENLRTAKADDQPDVSITLEELFEALDKEVAPLPPLKPGDITNKTIAAHYGISTKAAGDRMAKLCDKGEWVRVPKRHHGADVNTYRKAAS